MQKPIILGMNSQRAFQLAITHMWNCATSNEPSHKFHKSLADESKVCGGGWGGRKGLW